MVLYACIRYYLNTATAYDVTHLLTADLNWEDLVKTAIAQGVMPLLYQSLKVINTDRVPRSVMLHLQALNRINGIHSFVQTKKMLKILEKLDRSGIEAISFKGPALAASAYGNIALRQFSDLDILVHHQDFRQAKAVLAKQGYQSVASYTRDKMRDEVLPFYLYLQVLLSQTAPKSVIFDQEFKASLRPSNSEASIDLHWGIPPRQVSSSNRFKHLWNNFTLINILGKLIKTCSPEATLVIQCLNLAKEPWLKSLKQFCDVAQVIQAYPDLNWHLALKISAELSSQKLFLIALWMTRERLGILLPQLITERLVESQTIDEKMLKSFRKYSGNVPFLWFQYTYQLRTSDRPWDRAFITKIYVQWLLIVLLLPSPQDKEFILLPNKLYFFYYLIRPVRLLIKYLHFTKSVVASAKY